jgi:hypothetical protein
MQIYTKEKDSRNRRVKGDGKEVGLESEKRSTGTETRKILERGEEAVFETNKRWSWRKGKERRDCANVNDKKATREMNNDIEDKKMRKFEKEVVIEQNKEEK